MATTGIVATTGAITNEAALFVVLVFCGAFGYLFAVMTRRAIGVTPWRIPAIVWGLLSLVLLPPFGLIIEVLARFTTRLPAASRKGDVVERTPVPAQQLMTTFPANPAGGTDPWPAMAPSRPGPGGWRPAPEGAPWTSTPPLFGWYEDPTGSHEERYWDGREWSDHVRDSGVMSRDPLPPYAPVPERPPQQTATGPAAV